MKPVVYVAGPMRGIPKYNHPAFYEAEAMLVSMGFDVINPARLDKDEGFDIDALPDDFDWNTFPDGLQIRDVFKRDTKAICDKAQFIYMLPKWPRSKGARAERALFRALGLFEIRKLP